MVNVIFENKLFRKQIAKAAPIVKAKYFAWLESVRSSGLDKIQDQKQWRDHALVGNRLGQRSITLGGKWRAIYVIKNDEITFIEMQELTPHDY